TSTRRHHAEDGVVCRERLTHGRRNLVSCLGPDLHEICVTLLIGDETAIKALLYCRSILFVRLKDLSLVRRGHEVGQRNGDARASCPVETCILDAVERCCDLHLR